MIDSLSEGLISLENSVDTLDIIANTAPNFQASVLRQNVARPTKTEGIFHYSSSEENSGGRTDFSAGVRSTAVPSLFRQRMRRKKHACSIRILRNGGSRGISKSPQAVRTSRNARIKKNGRSYITTHSRADGSERIE